jgi:hypothetical protein
MIRMLRIGCVLFTSTVVLFVLVNIAAALAYPYDERLVVSGHPVFDEANRATYERIYQQPIGVAREIVGESWSERAWIFEPYVQFRERPRRSQFVNISTDGFRLNAPNAREMFDPATPAVFLLGGSTTFGYGVRDEDTIAAHLEALFRERQPGRPVAVYNFGRGYYGSGQEFLLLKLLVQRRMVPAAAIFIDGVNEQLCPTYSANIAEAFRIIQNDPWAEVRAVARSLPIFRALRSPNRSALVDNALYLDRSIAQPFAFECSCQVNERCHDQLMGSYLLNKQLVRAMGEQYGFAAQFTLQPVGGYKNRFTTSPFGPMPDRTQLWKWFEEHTMNGEGDYSLAGVLEDLSGDAFVDNLHYTSAAHRAIATAIYPRVAAALDAGR